MKNNEERGESNEFDKSTKELSDAIKIFYDKLFFDQEKLDDTGRKILYENLWDLYER